MKRATFAGHSLHPMLIVFPLGLLTTSVVWDIVHLVTGRDFWALLSFWTIVAGIVGGLLAAIPGLIDWLGIPSGTRANRVGLIHMLLNLAVMALFGLSLALRSSANAAEPPVGAMVAGWIGVLLALISSWLGGELVERLGVGVDEETDLDAPSSFARTRVPPPVRAGGSTGPA